MEKHPHHHHHNCVDEKSIKLLILSFVINLVLSIVEFLFGIISGSIALIGDALHNTSDGFAILVAVIAFKIGNKKASLRYTYGFKRAEVIGGFVNLILLFISGCFLFVEGIERLIKPEKIDGMLIIWISLFALIVDAMTAKISHHDAHHNTNMKMVFIHNLADVFGSVGVIISGICIEALGIYYIDGIVALLIAFYMFFQAVVSFPRIVNILMNAVPYDIDIEDVKKSILETKDVKGVHHIHLWSISEHCIALECHIESSNTDIIPVLTKQLKDTFDIKHCNIKIEKTCCNKHCDL